MRSSDCIGGRVKGKVGRARTGGGRMKRGRLRSFSRQGAGVDDDWYKDSCGMRAVTGRDNGRQQVGVTPGYGPQVGA